MLIDPSDLREQIVTVLSREFPLTVHELMQRLQSQYQRKVSKQAIHKVLRGLGSPVLDKHGHSYQLNPSFILKLSDWVEQCRHRYFPPDAQSFSVVPGETRTISCRSLLELDSLWNAVAREKILQYSSPAPDYCQCVPHAWFAITHLEAEIQITTFITERCRAFYTAAAGDTMLDHWIGRFYQGGNSFYKCATTLSDTPLGFQCSVIGEYVLETIYSDELMVRMGEIFKGTSSLSSLKLSELIRLVGSEREMSFSLRHDKAGAKRLRKMVMKNF